MKFKFLVFFFPLAVNLSTAQICSTSSYPVNDCSEGGCYINFFSMNNSVTQGDYGCSYNGYSFYGDTPRNLVIGSTVTWSINTDDSDLPGTGVAIWIDLNNDDIYQNSEMVASSTPKYQHSGSFIIPLTTAPYTFGTMRVRSGWNHYFVSSDHCADAQQFSGETEDYWINVVCGPGSGPVMYITPINNTICKGASAKLTGSGAAQYTWTPGNVYTNTITVSPTVGTTYTLTGKSSNCPNALSKKTMSVGVSNPTVIATPQTFIMCVEDMNEITGGGAITYTWSDQSVGPTMQFTASAAGNYTIGVSGQNQLGCVAVRTTTVKVEECVGVAEKRSGVQSPIAVFPNPSSSSFTIRAYSDTHVSIYDQTGKLCGEVNLNGSTTEIIVPGLSSGIYLLRATTGSSSSTTKIVITD